MGREVRNVAASVRARLRNLAWANRASLERVLTRYALERLLFKLSESPHKQRFVRKGAMLYAAWLEDPFRATRDLDLLAFGQREPGRIVKIFGDHEDLAWVLVRAGGTGSAHIAQRTVDRAEAGPEPHRGLAARSGGPDGKSGIPAIPPIRACSGRVLGKLPKHQKNKGNFWRKLLQIQLVPC